LLPKIRSDKLAAINLSSRAVMSVARIVLAVGALIALGTPGAADDYPSRPIRLVLGFTAGGPTDIPARFLAERLSVSLGKPVVVENKPGAGAMLAALDVLSRPRDGYDLLLCTYFDAVNTLLYRNVKYKLSDIVGISLIARYSYAVAVSNVLPAQSFKQLIDYTQENPNRVNYGHLGAGSTQNLLAKKLEKLTGMKMTAIPYKGTPEAMQEVIAGRTHVMIGPPLAILPLYETGQVKVLAVTGAERMASMPRVPTLNESGIPVVAYAWLGICAGSGTPTPQQPCRADRQLGGLSLLDREVGIGRRLVDAAGISRADRADRKRCGSDHPRIRRAVGLSVGARHASPYMTLGQALTRNGRNRKAGRCPPSGRAADLCAIGLCAIGLCVADLEAAAFGACDLDARRARASSRRAISAPDPPALAGDGRVGVSLRVAGGLRDGLR
jgi:tripartite-type tricarboxylate transporter receptor subunit TctC